MDTSLGARDDDSRFDAWLVDLDGTLYWQLPVRVAMATELALFGPHRIPMIRRFRREQEVLRLGPTKSSESPFQLQLARTAEAFGRETNEVAFVIREWLERRPGKWLKLFRRKGLLSEISAFRKAGGKTALVSDYPARAKLVALRAQDLFDEVIACGEPNGPTQLKPSPQGYLLACERLGVTASRCLVIGDRADADGLAAQAAQMQFRLIR